MESGTEKILQCAPCSPDDPLVTVAGRFFLQCIGKLGENPSERLLNQISPNAELVKAKIRFGLQFGNQEAIIQGIKDGELFSTSGYPFKLLHALVDRLLADSAIPDDGIIGKLFKKQETAQRALASIVAHFITKLPQDVLRPWLLTASKSDGFAKRWNELIPQGRHKQNRHNLRFVLRAVEKFDREALAIVKLLDQGRECAEAYAAGRNKENKVLADALQKLVDLILWEGERGRKWQGVSAEYLEIRWTPSVYSDLVMPFVNNAWNQYVSVPENAAVVLQQKEYAVDKSLAPGRFKLRSMAKTVLEAYRLNPIPLEQEEWFLDKFS